MKLDQNNRPVQVGTFLSDPQTVSLGVASTRSTTLKAATVYRLWSSVDGFFKFGDSSVTASTSSHPLKAGLDILAVTDSGSNLFVAGIVASGSGVLFISEIDVG